MRSILVVSAMEEISKKVLQCWPHLVCTTNNFSPCHERVVANLFTIPKYGQSLQVKLINRMCPRSSITASQSAELHFIAKFTTARASPSPTFHGPASGKRSHLQVGWMAGVLACFSQESKIIFELKIWIPKMHSCNCRGRRNLIKNLPIGDPNLMP